MTANVSELMEKLAEKDGNTAAQLSVLDHWLSDESNWSMTHQEFGEIFKFFQSNSATACAASEKLAAQLGSVYCPAIAQALSHISNSATQCSVVEKLAVACKDPQNVDVVLRQMGGPPSFANHLTLNSASEKICGEAKGSEYCKQFVQEKPSLLSEDSDSESDAGEGGGGSVAAAVSGAPPAWVEFWKRREQASSGDGELTASDAMFRQPIVELSFWKLGENPLPWTSSIPIIGDQFKAKWQERYARVTSDGLMFYFKDSSTAADALGVIALKGASVKSVGNSACRKHGDRFGFELKTPLPRKPDRKGPSEWILGGPGPGAEGSEEVLAQLKAFF